MYQVLLLLSQMRPISQTYACCGVSFVDAQPASIASIASAAAPSRRVTPLDSLGRAGGTLVAAAAVALTVLMAVGADVRALSPELVDIRDSRYLPPSLTVPVG